MSRGRRPPALLALTFAASACLAESTPTTIPEPVEPTLEASNDEVRDYLRPLASRLAQRPLLSSELQLIDELGTGAIDPVVQAWLQSETFAVAARDMMEHLLKTSGQLADIDYDLPGNLAAHIASHGLPYSALLTADFCVDADDAKTECDTTAPYAAGVLTTRAYLAANASRFNLRRATTLMNVFACRGYPMRSDLQPSVPKPELIEMFQALSQEEQVVEEAQSGFGNGAGCYTCHSQFASHAQLFVKFDATGLWREYAHGIQDEYGELGRSIGRFFASHFFEEDRSADETGQVFGRQVANLSEAAKAVVDDDEFLQCAAHRIYGYAFDIDETVSAKTDRALFADIAERLRDAGHDDPTFQQLFSSVVTHPIIVRAAMDQR